MAVSYHLPKIKKIIKILKTPLNSHSLHVLGNFSNSQLISDNDLENTGIKAYQMTCLTGSEMTLVSSLL